MTDLRVRAWPRQVVHGDAGEVLGLVSGAKLGKYDQQD